MTKFKIQETSKIQSHGIKCHICYKTIERKDGVYRVKYGNDINHLSCFYKWLNSNLTKVVKRNKELHDCYEELKKYMPQILAETITAKDIN
jgi:hypothetical protein